MDLEQNNSQNGELSTEGAPMNSRLIKVKRPKKRLEEEGNAPAVPSAPEVPKVNINEFDLDNYLDQSKLPVAPAHPVESSNASAPEFISVDEDLERAKWTLAFMQNDLFTKQALALSAVLAFLTGLLFANFFFSGETVVASNGLQGVIGNPNVPRGRARCGTTEKTQGCVLYIMNAQNRDLELRDLYELATSLTGRQRFIIETGNMLAANMKIKPGEIATLNIQPLQQ